MSPDDSDEHHVTSRSKRARRKGKSKLANKQSTLSLNNDPDDSSLSEPIFTKSTTSRRRTIDGGYGSRTDREEFGGQEESRLDARFDASTLGPSTAGTPLLSSSRASSNSTNIDEDELSDENDFHDVKRDPTDNSPYAQVRASVAATDDTSLSISTPRMWFLSIVFSIAGSSTNLFFSLRYPSVTLTPIIALLLVHPLGLLWDQVFKRSDDPEETFENGCRQKSPQSIQQGVAWKRRLRLWLGQGRWNEKEHCCVYVSSNVSFGFA